MRFKGYSIFTSWAGLLLLTTFLPAKGLSWVLRRPCFLYLSSSHLLLPSCCALTLSLWSPPSSAVITPLQISTQLRPSRDAIPYSLTEFDFFSALWYFFSPTEFFLFCVSHSSTGSAPLCCTLGTRSCVPACQNFSASLKMHQFCDGYRWSPHFLDRETEVFC